MRNLKTSSKEVGTFRYIFENLHRFAQVVKWERANWKVPSSNPVSAELKLIIWSISQIFAYIVEYKCAINMYDMDKAAPISVQIPNSYGKYVLALD